MFCLECGTKLPDETSTCTQCGWELASTTPMAAGVPEGNEMSSVAEALAGEYEVIEELGRGGMAIVYRGREISLDRDVAIKVLPFTFAFDKDFVERFQREARTAARLEHPHIIPIHRVGRSGNVIYFTMKFLRGESLARTIATRGALRPDEIKKLLIEAGGALGYAHTHKVVHRDVKPDNIMFTETGHSVVCDFGIAKAASESRLTGTGTAIGTPHYMSPEQARAQPLDGRSDLYSLGVVAYKCLTGHVPFDAEDSYAIGIKHITEPLTDPGLETPEQQAMFGIIERLMEKAPEDRFDSAAEMITALEGLDLGRTAATTPPPAHATTAPAQKSIEATEVSQGSGVTETPTTPMPRSTAQPAVAAPSRKSRKSRTPVLIGALIVIVGAGGGYAAMNRDSGPADTRPAEVIPQEAPETSANDPASNQTPDPPTTLTAGTESSVTQPATNPVRIATPPVRTPVDPLPEDAPPRRPVESPRNSPVPVPVETPPAEVDSPTAVDEPVQPPVQDSTSTTPPDRARGRTLADSLRARAAAAGVGRLEIRGLRNGSRLLIDGRRRLGLGHQLPEGDHTIVVEHRDYEPYESVVTITGGEITRLVVQQVRNDGYHQVAPG